MTPQAILYGRKVNVIGMDTPEETCGNLLCDICHDTSSHPLDPKWPAMRWSPEAPAGYVSSTETLEAIYAYNLGKY